MNYNPNAGMRNRKWENCKEQAIATQVYTTKAAIVVVAVAAAAATAANTKSCSWRLF